MIYYKKKSWFKKIYLKIPRAKFSISPVFALLKGVFALFFSFIIISYLSYLFLLPKFLDENFVENKINDYLNKNSKLSVDLDNLNLSPDYKFNIKLKANSIKIYYPNKKEFISIKNPNIDINLLTLFFNYIDLNKIKTDKITINTTFTKSKKYNSLEYFDFDILDLKKHNSKFQFRNINIISNEILFNLYDENINKYFYISSKNTKLSFGDNKKPLQLKGVGVIRTKNHKISDFDFNLEYLLPKDAIDNFKLKIEQLNYNPLVYMDKYKFYSNTIVKLKIIPEEKKTNINGTVLLKDYTFSVNGINLAKNKILINFKGEKISADCNFNLIKNQYIKASLVGRLAKNKFIELKINSNDIDLAEFKTILEHFAKIVNPKLNISDYSIQGHTKLNVYLKSDFKSITSNGNLSIEGAKLINKNLGLKLENINSNINFKDNKINIVQTSALVDKSKFYLIGSIDSNTNLNLRINSELINVVQIINLVKNLPLASQFAPKLKNIDFKKGYLKTTLTIKGTLKNPVVTTNSTIKDLTINLDKTIITTKEIIANSNSNNDIIITLSDSLINNPNFKARIPKSNLKVYKNKIDLLDTALFVDKNKINAKGKIDLNNDSAILFVEGAIPNNYIKNKNAFLKAKIHLTRKKLELIDTTITQGQEKLVLINGSIDNFDSFNNLKITILNKINIGFEDINLETKGVLTLNGKIKNPTINSSLNLYNIAKKDIGLFIKETTLNFKNSYALIEVRKAKLFNVDFDLSASGKYSNNKIIVEFLNFYSDYINLNTIEKKLTNKNPYNIEINHLKGSIGVLDILNSQLDSIIFEGKFNNNILTIDKLNAQGFKGKIEGSTTIDLKTHKTKANLVLKGLNIRYLSREIKELSIAQSGRLSAFLDCEFLGFDIDEIKKTFSGYVKFNINDGELTQFAKLERFLQAGNILSQSILKLNLNSGISALSKQNTGYFKTIEGTVKIQNSIANIQYIKSIGPNMSLYLTGKFNILTNNCSAEVLGRIPSSIVSVLGNVGKFSTGQLVDKMNNDAKDIIKTITTSPIEKMLSTKVAKEKTDKIPQLYNETYGITTREFIVQIAGPIENTSSIRNFKWIVY